MNSELQTGYTLRDILHILFKRKLVIAAFMLGTVVSAGVILKSYSPRMYEATTQILLSPGREHMLDLTTSSATAVPPRLSFDLDEHTARTIEMLTSKYLSEQLVETLGARTLCEEPVGFPLGLISRHFCDPRQSDEVLNELLRHGLKSCGLVHAKQAPFAIHARDLGALRPGLSLDNIGDLLDSREGPTHR